MIKRWCPLLLLLLLLLLVRMLLLLCCSMPCAPLLPALACSSLLLLFI
jgi:hypothetical protein